MPLQSIIQSLEQLTQLHQRLYSLSVQKTEILKKGDMDELQNLLKQEKKTAKAINQIEAGRLEQTTTWAKEHVLAQEKVTVTTMLEYLQGTESGQALEQATTQLAEKLVALKQQETLNQELTQQSLQFVQLSLDMIAPTIDSFNYGNIQQPSKRSVFDSKA